MGNWNMVIEGVGCHNNMNNPTDADVMMQAFVEQLKGVGHSIGLASFSTGHVPKELGIPFAGGFFGGEIVVAGERYALVVAPKAEGEKAGDDELQYKVSDRGTSSDFDGLANSDRINDDNHPAAQFCRSLRIGDSDDWYLPSRDELAMLCRNLGPTRATTPDLFKTGGAEAFEEDWYWSSTEYAPSSFNAWIVGFSGGTQNGFIKNGNYGVRAVRRL